MPLNSEQFEAVMCEADKVLCLAGAGTGKTYSMIARIARLVNQGVDPKSILVLTFTRAAAFEMKERYIKRNKGEIPTFQTFHAFCYSLLASNKKILHKLGYANVPTIIDQSAQKMIETKARMQCNTKLSVKKLSGDGSRLNQSEKFEYDLYHKSVKRIMISEELITFDILCSEVCQLFTDDDDTIKSYKSRYKYVFVDEFQDTDPTQWRFVSSFKNSKIFVVGDALQSIYRFRNADSSIIKGLANDRAWKTIKLYQNYRSTRQICKFANDNSKYADSSYRIEISAEKDGPVVNMNYISDNRNSSDTVSPDTLNLIATKVKHESGTTAILCRSNSEVDAVLDMFHKSNIQVTSSKKDTDSINILKAVNDDEFLVDWCSTFLNSQKYAEFIRLVSVEGVQHRGPFFYDKFHDYFAVGYYLSVIMEIRTILANSKLTGVMKCSEIFKTLDLNIKPGLECIDVKTPEDIINACIRSVNYHTESEIYVGTIHSSKGLEYDNVHVVGVDSRSFRLNSEDNLNLYYVAITRAKTNLHIYRSLN